MRKNVCMIVQHFYPADVRVRKEAAALVSRGHRVSVIALGDLGEKNQEVVDGVEVYRIFLSKKRAGPTRYIVEYIVFFLYCFYKLNILELKQKFDVVHINTLPDFLVFAAIIQKMKKEKIVLDMHEIMPEFFMSKFGVSAKHPVVRLLLFLEKISLKFADHVITINEPIKRIFQSRAIPDRPITVVMNTMDSASVATNFEKRDHSTFNCVYHGTITDIYGLDAALQGFAKANKKISNLLFHVFGDGPDVPYLKRLVGELGVEDKVIFHGKVPHGMMIDALSRMDVGILATRKDIFLDLSFSNKLAEYVQLKIPVIASDLAATKYYFSGEDILFFEAGNTDDLCRKIEIAYTNRERISVMAENAYERCRAINWDIMAARYIEVIEQQDAKAKPKAVSESSVIREANEEATGPNERQKRVSSGRKAV